jgi:SAM-dependent methyltransferase
MLEAYKRESSQVHKYYAWALKECENILKKYNPGETNILDVGCSCGVLLRCLSDMGYHNLRGIELNRISAEAGARELGIQIISKPVEDLPRTEKYDLILSLALLEHLTEPWKILSLYYDILNDGGSVLFLVPNYDGYLRTIMGKDWLWYMPPFHIHHFTVESVKRMAESQGYRITRVATMNAGTYLYLISRMIFGEAKTQESTKQNLRSLRKVMWLDKAVRLLLSPLIVPMKYLQKEAHIVGVITK